MLLLLNKIFAKIYRQIDVWKNTLFPRLRIQNLSLLSEEQKYNFSLRLAKLIYWGLVTILVFSYLPLLARHIPHTEGFRKTILSYLYAALATAWKAIIGYIPNLLIIFITGIVTYYIIRFCQFFFNAIDRGRLSFSGFDQDWAKPTLKIIVLLILAVAFAIIFPYLPGAEAPAFKGVSILIGALITLGGAGAVSNLIGGVIIIYTRAFRIGDIIQTERFRGVVYEKTILSTRIRTMDNEIVTIPNAILVASSIVNCNTLLRELNEPIVVHTTITLGYDVPWRKVEGVLVEAALATSGILENPIPYVQPTSLDDFYVSYKLRAYTKDLSKLKDIYIQIHQNILDKCNGFVQFFVKHHSDGRGRFWCTQQGGEVFFVCNNPPYRYWVPGSTHAFDYSMVFMLKVLQAYLGPSWKPTRVYFRGPYVKDWESYELLANVNLYFNCNYGIIVFPSLLLDSVRLRESPSLLTKDLSAYLQFPSSGSFADSLKVLMRSLLAQKVFDINSVAEMIDISPRSLQRHLQQDQTSYSQLLENLRYELAMQKITHTDLEFQAIAQELGYSTTGHFTRAFKRWTGKTATQFRQQQKLIS